MARIVNYFKETRGEMKHVSWPTRKQAAYFTVVIIIVSLLTSFFLGFFDFIFTRLLDIFIV